MIIFYAAYLTACTITFGLGVRTLHHMTRRCNSMRRLAFVLSTTGACVAYVEAAAGAYPLASALMISVGVAILHVIGSRETGRMVKVRA